MMDGQTYMSQALSCMLIHQSLQKLQDIHALILILPQKKLRVNQMNTQIFLFLKPFLFLFWLEGDSASPVTPSHGLEHGEAKWTPLSPHVCQQKGPNWSPSSVFFHEHCSYSDKELILASFILCHSGYCASHLASLSVSTPLFSVHPPYYNQKAETQI